MKKRILSVVLTLLMVFSMIPATSLTAQQKTDSSAYCTVRIMLRDGNGNYICSWIGKGGVNTLFKC